MVKKRDFVVLLCLAGFAGLCYGAILPTYFLSDDFVLIARVVRRAMFTSWGSETGDFFRPVALLSFLVDFRIWGLNPVGFHVTNIFFHALSGFAVFLLARLLFKSFGTMTSRLPSVLCGSLFIALSSHSESVTWISGRTDVIATALGLTATAFFVFLIRRRSVLLCVLSLLLLSGALLTKECAVALPVVWAVCFAGGWLATRRRPSAHSIVVLAAAMFCLAAYVMVRKIMIGHFVGGYGTRGHLAFLHLKSVVNFLRYAIRTFMPAMPLRSLGRFRRPVFFLAAVLGAGVLALAAAVVVRRRRFRPIHWPLPGVLAACFGISLLPVLTMGVSIGDTQGERFLYLPSAFACILLVYLVAALVPHKRLWALAVSLLVASEAVALQWVNQRWITASRLSREIAYEVSETDPGSTVVLNVPDNFRGAYVFRNGLAEAATTFLVKPGTTPYSVVCTHEVNSLGEVFEARSDTLGDSVTLVLPDSLKFCEIDERGFEVQRYGNTLVLANVGFNSPKGASLLSYRNGTSRPMLQAIGGKASTDGAPKSASAAHRRSEAN